MKQKLLFLLILFILKGTGLTAQSCANYAIARTTGSTYTSILGSSPSYFTWQNLSSNQDDDNRSYQESIGFEFWYLGTRYTNFSASLNGTIDFSSSTSDGNNGGEGPYGPNYNNPFSTASMSMLCLAPLYDDLWTAAGGTTAVAASIFYKTTGSAPNRLLTIEWHNFENWSSSTGSLNFQVKIYETTGKIEFCYGTMTAGTAAAHYACGINGNWTFGGPTASTLLCQQTANSTTFNSTASNGLASLPASNSKLSFTPPNPSAAPTNISFTAVSKTGMTLHWTDNANNEVGYAIYHSLDNINFTYSTVTAANATSAIITGLLPSTTYYWQVHAVTEGVLSNSLGGTKATLPAGIINSVTSGNWNNTATWDCNCVPTLGDDVIIKNGHTVTLNANGVCNSLTVGQGVSGQLTVGNSSTARTLTIDSDLVVYPGAILTTGATAATHSLIVDNNIINNGNLNLAPTVSRVCNLTLNNTEDTDHIISGSGPTTNFNLMTVNLSSSTKRVDVTATNFAAPNNFLTLVNGIFRVSTGTTITPFTSDATIGLSTGIEVNHSSAVVNTTGGNITLLGLIKISSGNFNIGNASDNNLLFDNGSLTIEGGAMSIAGRLDKLGVTALVNLTMTGGTLSVSTVGSTTASKAPFQIDEPGSNLTMSGGNIIVRKPGAGNLGFFNTGATNGTVTGGTIQIGDGSTPAGQTFQINSTTAIPALVVSNGVAVTVQLTANLTVVNNISINAGTLNGNSHDIAIGGNLTNNGTLTVTSSTVTCNGTGSQSIGGTSSSSFNNLSINKASSTVSILTNATVTGSLSFTSGKISIDNHNLSIGTAGSISGYSSNNYIIAIGTGTLIQQVKNGFSKTFPIGTTTAYTPAIVALSAGSTTDNISARVSPSVHFQGTTGNLINTSAVNATWIIAEETAGGSNATITLQWPASLEMVGFNRLFSRLAHYTGSGWDYGNSDIPASGSNPYFISRGTFTSYTEFVVSMMNALPLTWLSISGKNENGDNLIKWSTASEQDVDYFAVEYSENGIDFLEAGHTGAAGNSSNIENYSFLHRNVQGLNTYYRIKEVDLDGRFSYSKVIRIASIARSGNYVVVLSNPIRDFANVLLKVDKAASVSIQILDIAGRIIHSSSKDVLPGVNNIKVDMSVQPAGMYLLRLNDKAGYENVTRLIK